MRRVGLAQQEQGEGKNPCKLDLVLLLQEVGSALG